MILYHYWSHAARLGALNTQQPGVRRYSAHYPSCQNCLMARLQASCTHASGTALHSTAPAIHHHCLLRGATVGQPRVSTAHSTVQHPLKIIPRPLRSATAGKLHKCLCTALHSAHSTCYPCLAYCIEEPHEAACIPLHGITQHSTASAISHHELPAPWHETAANQLHAVTGRPLPTCEHSRIQEQPNNCCPHQRFAPRAYKCTTRHGGIPGPFCAVNTMPLNHTHCVHHACNVPNSVCTSEVSSQILLQYKDQAVRYIKRLLCDCGDDDAPHSNHNQWCGTADTIHTWSPQNHTGTKPCKRLEFVAAGQIGTGSLYIVPTDCRPGGD